jgi:hypothetical protein
VDVEWMSIECGCFRKNVGIRDRQCSTISILGPGEVGCVVALPGSGTGRGLPCLSNKKCWETLKRRLSLESTRSSMASPQPIALPVHTSHDYIMGSYSEDPTGTFNPASYTRHFLGSPISWRAGSFSQRFPQGSPTAQLLSSIEYVLYIITPFLSFIVNQPKVQL